MKDELGDRMKDFYEDRTRFKLARRTNTIIRIDGKAFHTYTKGLERPFDLGLMEDMNKTTEYLCQNIQGAKFGYVQSDEISILITDYDDISTHAWFDGNLQKMASIAASLATSKFNQLRMARFARNSGIEPKYRDESYIAGSEIENFKLAMFDARVFQIPYQEEVFNYFIWRQQDATRNSISSVAQNNFSAKELNGKKTSDMQDMLMLEKDINWNDFSPREKRGALIRKVEKKYVRKVSVPTSNDGKTYIIPEDSIYTRNVWEADPETPIFSKDKDYLKELMPNLEK
jgi:tRNA(His) 5'-end guanylyltransferase